MRSMDSVTRFGEIRKNLKSLTISWENIYILAKLWTYMGKYFLLLGKLSMF